MTMMTDTTTLGLNTHGLHDPFVGNTRLEAMIILTTVLALIGLGVAVWTWGLVALTLTAVAAVPVVFVLLIRITLG